MSSACDGSRLSQLTTPSLMPDDVMKVVDAIDELTVLRSVTLFLRDADGEIPMRPYCDVPLHKLLRKPLLEYFQADIHLGEHHLFMYLLEDVYYAFLCIVDDSAGILLFLSGMANASGMTPRHHLRLC
eukprot:TRINITY_DN5230_c0_g1_i1.p3 TRINITY_DN5230_c0_g1~~TRINITY_DN5230_c0_g1_i1.p3  ORF type:complete len:128 (+),score=25.19 TRINITY_DN5230_c0_g1_i1:692-1075(+)